MLNKRSHLIINLVLLLGVGLSIAGLRLQHVKHRKEIETLKGEFNRREAELVSVFADSVMGVQQNILGAESKKPETLEDVAKVLKGLLADIEFVDETSSTL